MKFFLIAFSFSLFAFQGFAGVFSTAGHPKSNGINVEIHYSDKWTTLAEGKRPHIVQQFKDEQHNYCLLQIRDAGEFLSTKQWATEFRYMTPRDFQDIAGEGINITNIKHVNYEDQAGVLMHIDMCMERLGVNVCMAGLVHMLGYKNSVILVQCLSAAPTKTQARLAFESALPDFMLFGNAIVLPDRYTESPIAESPQYAEVFNPFLGILLFFGFIITIAILPYVIKKYAEIIANKFDNSSPNKKE